VAKKKIHGNFTPPPEKKFPKLIDAFSPQKIKIYKVYKQKKNLKLIICSVSIVQKS
jgi:predicted nucleic acid binding AN1-type Zn finger protein